jgi:hypothetical protein
MVVLVKGRREAPKFDEKVNAFRFDDLIKEKRAFGPINYRQVSRGGLQVPVRKLSWVGGRHLIKPSELYVGLILKLSGCKSISVRSLSIHPGTGLREINK